MPLYQVGSGDAVNRLKPASFRNEKELQGLFEDNLEALLGVRFISSEFTTGDQHRGRIDTLGLDEDGSPTIIEYKKTMKENIISQGLFYMHWLIDHKGDFTMAAKKELGDDVEIDWSQPRLILIAQSFSHYDQFAVSTIGVNVDLWTYRFYDGQYLYLEAMYSSSKSDQPVTDKPTQKNQKQESFLYTVAYHLKGKPTQVKELFNAIRGQILALDEEGEIAERPLKMYIGYKHGKNICSLKVQKQGLKLYLDVPYDQLSDPYKIAKDVRHIGHHGTGDIEVRVQSPSDIDKVMVLIEQAYQQTM